MPVRYAARVRIPRIPHSLLALCAGLAAGAFACGPASVESGPAAEKPPITVELLKLEPELLRDTATFSGQLDAEYSVELKAETSGVIEELLFQEGQTVKKGAVLFRLRDDEQKARLAEAVANRDLAQEVWDRTQQLVSRDAASAAQKDRATAELAVAKARVDLARLAVERTRIAAPFDGVVGARFVAPGDRITDKKALVRIDAIDRLQLSFAISEQGVAFARTGVKLDVRVRPYPDETFPGEVFFVSPSLDPATRRMILKAWVPNADRRLRPGLFANVDLELAQRENAMLIPESAVVFDRAGSYVWRVRGEIAERVPIEIGLRKNGRVEVTLGLAGGDTIVTAGTHKVIEGRKLRAAAPEKPEKGDQAGVGPRAAAPSESGS
jgi:membrane fusion protein (multidrug efflux system)